MLRNRTAVNPKDTLDLLDQLCKLGYSDDAFWRLHHFRDTKREKIAGFRRWCKRVRAFERDGNNERVHERLKLVLTRYKAKNLPPGQRQVFADLADKAFAEIPRKP